MRLNWKQKEALKKKYDVDRIWSFSMINSFHNCPWEYKMKYIDHEKVNTDNVYTIFGTECHDTIQGYYEGKLTYDDMKKEWESFVDKWAADPASYHFDNDKIKAGYLNNISHYFEHTDVIKDADVKNELPVLIVLTDDNDKRFVFVGYVDSRFKTKDGKRILVDYKSSSKSGFSKSKLPEKSMQLMLYAMGFHQQNNLDYDDIECKFDMMKYCTVHFLQENGKWKTSIQERSKWVEKMEKKLQTKLKKLGYDTVDSTLMIQEAIVQNNLENMPQKIKEEFYITNYFININVNTNSVNEVASQVIDRCHEILDFENIEDLESYLEIHYPYDPDNYYCNKLCAYHSTNKFKEENAILGELEPEQDLDALLGDNNLSVDNESKNSIDAEKKKEYSNQVDIINQLLG